MSSHYCSHKSCNNKIRDKGTKLCFHHNPERKPKTVGLLKMLDIFNDFHQKISKISVEVKENPYYWTAISDVEKAEYCIEKMLEIIIPIFHSYICFIGAVSNVKKAFNILIECHGYIYLHEHFDP